MLVCNYRKCRQPLKICAVGTVCKHIFCITHSPLQLKTADGTFQCPACKYRLKENSDIIEVDLQPCEQFRSMILMGQAPDTILDVCRRAIDFFNMQTVQGVKYLEYINYKLEERYKNMETQCKSVLSSLEQKINKLQSEKDAIEKECEELRDKLVASTHKLSQLEGDISRLNLSKRTDSDQTCLSDHVHTRSAQSTQSSDTLNPKFPRCSPDSTYASPFCLNSGHPHFNFTKRPDISSSNLFLGQSSRKSPTKLLLPNHFLNGSLRNLSKGLSKPFYK
ncbi:hypothetical protein MN116_006400 [Schistosoma mekongi]|uniref:RING-type domain-containing protein n=1 Tax=Schistosoma mekongi TaxID=38744 RepID=A0AAE2D486_SCHME|nr:hypothetical protein MN116_006400 [Schistosoma mekongi]